ncbi:hypothetical protein [Brevundimonas sp.]|uniref:hypothetical protein n=1 Tax=Brevundimonas sp. TaxID=1871086 RepID=UPI002AB844C9|nr:hypothetical protein [Brevundimonas sp.]MDZ4363028.1 hypothetical protein [Brevundimonas sp.]
MKTAALQFALGALLLVGCSSGDLVSNEAAACDLVKTRVTESHRLPGSSRIAFCDRIPAADVPSEFYVLALHSDRKCEGICSTHLGWFAVQKSTSTVFDWNVAEWQLGQPVSQSQ